MRPIEKELKSGELVLVLPDWAPPPVPVHIVYSGQIAPPLRVRAYLDFLIGTWGATRPWEAKLEGGLKLV